MKMRLRGFATMGLTSWKRPAPRAAYCEKLGCSAAIEKADDGGTEVFAPARDI